jgi:hypothetical protein
VQTRLIIATIRLRGSRSVLTSKEEKENEKTSNRKSREKISEQAQHVIDCKNRHCIERRWVPTTFRSAKKHESAPDSSSQWDARRTTLSRTAHHHSTCAGGARIWLGWATVKNEKTISVKSRMNVNHHKTYALREMTFKR